MIRLVLAILFLFCVILKGSGEPVDVDTLSHYIHPKADLFVHAPPPASLAGERNALSPREATDVAIPMLLQKGITNLMICEVSWITAPFSGYLIDARGTLRKNENILTVFRLGIHDGEDEESGPMYTAGNEFVFLAFGTDSTDSSIWYPDPGPDATPEEIAADADRFLAYEFLLDREAFESLPERYPLFEEGGESE